MDKIRVLLSESPRPDGDAKLPRILVADSLEFAVVGFGPGGLPEAREKLVPLFFADADQFLPAEGKTLQNSMKAILAGSSKQVRATEARENGSQQDEGPQAHKVFSEDRL